MQDPSEELKRLNAELKKIRKQTRQIKKDGKTTYTHTKRKGWQSKENY